jgi:zinc transport system substrate-binding protein
LACGAIIAAAGSNLCCRRAETTGTGKIMVAVSILPQSYFVRRIGGDYVSVTTLVGPGQEPHTFDPTPKQVSSLAQAKLYFTIGIGFEAGLVGKIRGAFPNVRIVDMAKGVKFRAMTAEEAGAEEDAHMTAGEPDPHTWLDPKLAKIEAGNVCDALSQADPAHAAEYRKNFEALAADLDAVDAKIAKALAPLKGRDFITYHPAFGYFGDAYGLHQVSVEMEGKEPSARQLVELIGRAKKENIRVIFVQPQFSTKNAETMAQAIGGAVVPMDDLAPEYIENLQHMAAEIEKALGPNAEPPAVQ